MSLARLRAFVLMALASCHAQAFGDSVFLAGVGGFFKGAAQGVVNIGNGLLTTGQELTYMTRDLGVGIYETGALVAGYHVDSSPSWSSAGQYLENGGSVGAYYGNTAANLTTFGVYGQVQAGVQLYNGEISVDEASARIGSTGVLQLGGAAAIRYTARPSSFWKQPLQELPAHVRAVVSRRPTPYMLRNEMTAGDIALSPYEIALMKKDPAFSLLLEEAQANPTFMGKARCYEAARRSDGGWGVRRSGIDKGQSPKVFAENGLQVNPSAKNVPCALPKATLDIVQAGTAPSQLTVTQGGLIMRGPSLSVLTYKPPCPHCQYFIEQNGLVQWSAPLGNPAYPYPIFTAPGSTSAPMQVQ